MIFSSQHIVRTMSLLLSSSDEPIKDRNQLVEYFIKGAKPKERWLIGCEHEKFAFRLPNA